MEQESTNAHTSTSTRKTSTRGRKGHVWVDGTRQGQLPWSKGKVALLVGLPLFLILGALIMLWGVPHIEKDLKAKGLKDLAAANVSTDSLDIDMSFRNATVTGELPAGATEEDIRSILTAGDIRDVDFDLGEQAAPDPDPTPQPPTAVPETPEPTEAPEPDPTAEPEPDPTAEPEPTPEPEPDPTPSLDVPDQDELASQTAALQEELDALSNELRDTVNFSSDNNQLTPGAKVTLDKVVVLMEQYNQPSLGIAGHTDGEGDEFDNLRLSLLRASTVRDYLVQQGISPSRLEAFGFGESEPIASNDTAEGRLENRRVQLTALESLSN